MRWFALKMVTSLAAILWVCTAVNASSNANGQLHRDAVSATTPLVSEKYPANQTLRRLHFLCLEFKPAWPLEQVPHRLEFERG
jgi:hypothetical protein